MCLGATLSRRSGSFDSECPLLALLCNGVQAAVRCPLTSPRTLESRYSCQAVRHADCELCRCSHRAVVLAKGLLLAWREHYLQHIGRSSLHCLFRDHSTPSNRGARASAPVEPCTACRPYPARDRQSGTVLADGFLSAACVQCR